MVVRIGQVWASTDRRDVEAKHNQHRQVVAIETSGNYAHLQTPSGTHRVRIGPDGIERHRLVRQP